MSFTSLVSAAAEVHSEPAIHPYLIGAAAFAILLVMLFALLMFGKGRDHS